MGLARQCVLVLSAVLSPMAAQAAEADAVDVAGGAAFAWPPSRCSAIRLDAVPWNASLDASGFGRVAPLDGEESLDRILRLRLESFYDALDTTRIRKRRVGPRLSDVRAHLPAALSAQTMQRVLADGDAIEVPVLDHGVIFAHALSASAALSCRAAYLHDSIAGARSASPTARIEDHAIRRALERGDEWRTAAQLSEDRRLAELDAQKLRYRMDQGARQVEHAERRTERELALDMRIAQYKSELLRNRSDDRMRAGPAFFREERALREEASRDVSAVELAAATRSLGVEFALEEARIQHEASREGEAALLRARTEASLEEESEAEDLRELAARGARRVAATREAVATAFAVLGDAVEALSSTPVMLLRALAGLLAVIVGSYAACETVTFLIRAGERHLLRPQLIRHTSVSGLVNAMPARGNALLRSLSAGRGSRGRQQEPSVGGPAPVLGGDARAAVKKLRQRLRAAVAAGEPLPNVMVHGATGVGKMAVARYLVEAAGMDVAVISGGDIGGLGSSAIAEIRDLFAWSRRVGAARGLALILDDAEGALHRRDQCGASEAQRASLGALLYHTSATCPAVSVFLLTSMPQSVDGAMLDRMDAVLELPLPGKEARVRMLERFVGARIARRADEMLGEDLRGVLRSRVRTLAARTRGAACRELQSIVASIEAEALAGIADGSGGRLSLERWDAICEERIREIQEKQGMRRAGAPGHAGGSARRTRRVQRAS